jgi:KaiC/GvpD/RAD55 family RecA-like ATPase
MDQNDRATHPSTDVERLDTMLSGGYYRGTSVLISGNPGTAKSTLSGAFTATPIDDRVRPRGRRRGGRIPRVGP